MLDKVRNLIPFRKRSSLEDFIDKIILENVDMITIIPSLYEAKNKILYPSISYSFYSEDLKKNLTFTEYFEDERKKKGMGDSPYCIIETVSKRLEYLRTKLHTQKLILNLKNIEHLDMTLKKPLNENEYHKIAKDLSNQYSSFSYI